jgi:hypothetical protein
MLSTRRVELNLARRFNSGIGRRQNNFVARATTEHHPSLSDGETSSLTSPALKGRAKVIRRDATELGKWIKTESTIEFQPKPAPQPSPTGRGSKIHFKYGLRSNRFSFDNSGAHKSPAFSIRLRTLSRRKSSILIPRSISFHVTGVDTAAFGVGLTE